MRRVTPAHMCLIEHDGVTEGRRAGQNARALGCLHRVLPPASCIPGNPSRGVRRARAAPWDDRAARARHVLRDGVTELLAHAHCALT
jgi:hypothetical protein